MRRTVPLLITAISGFVLIVSFFIPVGESLGDRVAIWFDLLASIAFVLGGGNLIKMHLKKIADQVPGWGYSGVTLLAFFVTLYVGLAKWGVPPAPQQEFYGESFAKLTLDELPESLTFSVPGTIPQHPSDEPLPASVRKLISSANDQIIFRGWMQPAQREDLFGYDPSLRWRRDVELLFEQAQPKDILAGKVAYYANHQALSFRGFMTDEQHQALLNIADTPAWKAAVEQLHQQSQKTVSVPATMPESVKIPPALAEVVTYDPDAKQLSIKGPMSQGQRMALANQFPIARPVPPPQQQQLLQQLRDLGPVTEAQAEEFDKHFLGSWTVELLHEMLDQAGLPEEVPKSYSEMYEEQQAGEKNIQRSRTVGENVRLNEQQVEALREFAQTPTMTIAELTALLRERGNLTGTQATVLNTFLGRVPTIGEDRKDLAFAMLRKGPLNQQQQDLLFEQFRVEHRWRADVTSLFLAAHTVKYPWSGQYRAQESPFWWLYEYAFKPLTATMFAILAFYVASAAFRAFRAKNFEAILLLGTAFIILLGRTFAGVMLTSFLPEDSPFRIENMTVFIMQVFNTAGNRAIMIGIALGIASTSLKVLLGIDRSYLGSGED